MPLGKRRHLVERHGQRVISPTGVRSVLREAGLWSPPGLPRTTVDGTPDIDMDWLVSEVQRGIRLDVQHRPREAATVLNAAVWTPLLRDPGRIAALLREPVTGSWLLRGALQLAHALIDTGRWASALWYLRLVEDWLRRDDARPSATQATFQDEGDCWLLAGETTWRVGNDAPADARHALKGRTSRRYRPDRQVGYQGVIGHDLAVLEQRAGYPVDRVLADLDEAEPLLEASGNRGFLASAALARARAIRQGEPGDTAAVERLVETAVARARQAPSPMIRVKVAIDGAALLARMRDLSPREHERLHAAARTAIDRGFAGQACKLVADPRLLAVVHDLEGALRDLS